MPLAFESSSHGRIAFGFFNVESDMLLCEGLFFFADRFCEAVAALAADASRDAAAPTASVAGWRIRPAQIGNLHGAIAGTDHSGFLGAVYARFPFPERAEDFKQSPEGSSSQAVMTELIAPLGEATTIVLGWDPRPGTVALGEYTFSAPGFAALTGYVAEGGYPRYRDGRQPAYVRAMMATLQRTGWPPRRGAG